jgi:hypothetical protein
MSFTFFLTGDLISQTIIEPGHLSAPRSLLEIRGGKLIQQAAADDEDDEDDVAGAAVVAAGLDAVLGHHHHHHPHPQSGISTGQKSSSGSSLSAAITGSASSGTIGPYVEDHQTTLREWDKARSLRLGM